MNTVTLSRKVVPGKIKSVIKLNKSVFHVTSHFDKNIPLADILLAAVSEMPRKNQLLGSDRP